MTGRVFLNYRRGDDAGTVGRLYDRLAPALGHEAIFMDVEGHIKAGDDYVDVLRAQVAQCDVLLAVIGPRWLTLTDEAGRRRLDNPDDWVRVEIASALEASGKKRVIPVLVPGADMPRVEDLPDDLKPLARKQAVRITLERFNADAQGLVGQLTSVLDDLARQRAASEAERAAAAAAERQRETEEAARLVAVEARAREQRASGMSAEDVRKAEELTNWDFIKEHEDLDELRDHLARFPGGITERYARARLAALTFKALSATSPIEILQAFVVAFPKSEHTPAVQAWLAAAEARAKSDAEAAARRVRETEAWVAIAASTDEQAIRDFLKTWPSGDHAADAKTRLKELQGAGRFSRRAILKGVGYGVAGTAAVGGAGIATFVPGMPLWRLINDRSVRTLAGHDRPVNSVAFSPDSKLLLSAGGDSTVKLWEVASGRETRAFRGHFSSVEVAVFVPDGSAVVSGSFDNNVKVWALASGSPLGELLGDSAVRSLAISSDGELVLVGYNSGTAKVWNIKSGRTVRTFSGHRQPVRAAAFSPDGKFVLTASDDDTVRVYSYPQMSLISTVTLRLGPQAALFNADGSSFYTAGWAGLQLWDTRSGLLKHGYPPNSCLSQENIAIVGKIGLQGHCDWTLDVWDLNQAKLIRKLYGSESTYSVAISPDGKHAAAGSHAGEIKLWDLTSVAG